MELIDKAAIVAEIKRRIDRNNENAASYSSNSEHDYLCRVIEKVYKNLLSFLNTLEVKEVDLEEAARHYLLHEHLSPLNEVMHKADIKAEMQYHKDIENAFKAGFKLGLKAKDVNEIIKTAEDHAYFAGSENTRGKLIDKACEWLDDNLHYYWGSISADPHNFLFDFRKAMEE